jgi:hypothetical protein
MTWLTIALGFLLALVALVAWAVVRVGAMADRAARAEEAAHDGQAYRETREKMDEVIVGDDPAAARRWLRERAAK